MTDWADKRARELIAGGELWRLPKAIASALREAEQRGLDRVRGNDYDPLCVPCGSVDELADVIRDLAEDGEHHSKIVREVRAYIASALRDARREGEAARDAAWREALNGMADGIQADSGDTYAAEMLRGAARIVSDALANGQLGELRALAAGGKAE